MKKTIFLIDGFNLYHAISAQKTLRKYKWLNLHSLCSSFLTSNEKINKIFYFTAYYPGNGPRRQKHQLYVRALELHEVTTIFGEFKRKDKFCKSCYKTSEGYEEKQTDVNIAIELFRQAVNDTYDTAYIISGDSDLLPSIRAVKSTFPEKTIKLILPPMRQSESLKKEVHWYMRMKEKHLANNQFLEKIERNGITLQKPEDWK
ncbi:MAG: NYN domain-containing protein [Deltaproteobacteria bacterium]|nr:NYN domain-containing protein [Deltaproteobacteria bacterium]